MTAALLAIGDIHGQLGKLQNILAAADLVDSRLRWTGRDVTLWFLGDFVDRGPDGIGVIDLVMDLQAQAAAGCGRVRAVLGNHDVQLLAAHYFGDQKCGGPGGTFRSSWLANGGLERDLELLTERHADWIKSLPAMARDWGTLLAHADATFYRNYGRSITAVNETIAGILRDDDAGTWDMLLEFFSQRRAFVDRFLGRDRAARFLRDFGGLRFVHGHTPISKMTNCAPESVVGPYTYAGGLCVNCDSGLYLGGPGFVAELPALEPVHDEQRPL